MTNFYKELGVFLYEASLREEEESKPNWHQPVKPNQKSKFGLKPGDVIKSGKGVYRDGKPVQPKTEKKSNKSYFHRKPTPPN